MSSKKRRREKRAKAWGFYGTEAWIKLRRRVIQKYGKTCMKCGHESKRPHVDHILPRSLYPDLALEFSNLQVLCKLCNFAKGNKDFTDWRSGKRTIA